MGGMTDKLLRLAVLAEQDDSNFTSELHLIGDRYASTARELIKGDQLVSLLDELVALVISRWSGMMPRGTRTGV